MSFLPLPLWCDFSPHPFIAKDFPVSHLLTSVLFSLTSTLQRGTEKTTDPVKDSGKETNLPDPGNPDEVYNFLSGIDWMLALQNAILVLVICFFGWIISGICGRLVNKSLEKAKIDITLRLFFSKLARWAILLITGITVLSRFGVETTSFAAVIGAGGLAIGLAFQGTLSNFASGVMLLIFRPFKVGDVVNVSGVTGGVKEIELFTTAIDTPDNRRFIIPNSAVFGATIENITYHDTRRIDVAVGSAYDADVDHTRVVLKEAILGIDGILTDPEPAIYLTELGASSIDWSVRVWCNTPDYWNVREQVVRKIKVALDEAGIGIPFPQMDIHFDQPMSS